MGEKVDISSHLLEEARSVIHDPAHLGVLPCESRHGGIYPKVDLAIWLRSCIKEVSVPIEGQVRGTIPHWITGDFLQNGPGKFYFGEDVFKHLFDGSALLQKYSIEKGKVHYQCRFLRTKSFQKNLASNSISVTEFGTNANGNNSYQRHIPCDESNPEKPTAVLSAKKKRSLQERFSFLRGRIDDVMSDNTMISVYPLGRNYFCFYESPFLQQVDPLTLNTLQRVDLNKKLGVLSHASHPHYDEMGNMLTIGMRVGLRGPEYVVNKFPVHADGTKKELVEGPFEGGSVVTSVPARWLLEPGYMHSFAMTEHYYILIEQPLCVSVPGLVTGLMTSRALIDAMRWRGNKDTLFHVINRLTGKATKISYKTDPFFYLHTINAYEESGQIVIDISCYKNPNMLYCMNLEALQTAQSSQEYADLFRGRPQRFVLPLVTEAMKKGQNLVTLSYTKATAIMDNDGSVRLTPETICNVGCETPTINYEAHNGKKYRYFYAITSDVDDPVSAGQIYKIDTLSGKVISWSEDNAYCAEPMFIPRPDSKGEDGEDDGVIISSMIRGEPDVNYAGLVVLDARTMTELGRAEFRLDGPAPKPLHGYFTGNNVSDLRSKRK